jgi:hypothetical protein
VLTIGERDTADRREACRAAVLSPPCAATSRMGLTMGGIQDIVDAFGEAWNERDRGKRRQLLEKAWADDGALVDSERTVVGRDALMDLIEDFQEEQPWARMEFTSKPEEHYGSLRITWALVRTDGTRVEEGVDFGELAEDGRLRKIVSFFGLLPFGK